ncbi:MAG TPA: pyruvate carboxylase subunit B [Chitinivibrionales bacterium]|nr:pyruvate carboxylase subunit B [Chitinivibrionales bacterium]
MANTKKQSKENKLHKIPLRITDTTLRDAHQSLWATRMRTEDIVKIVDVIDGVGYYSLECWGGATFDVCLRFLRENPWERLRLIKSKAKKTPLQMLLRGQNLVGYRNYADDVVERFVALACENGMDIFRVFDALNDTRNIEAAIRAVKKHGGHAQGTLAYTISPVHTIEKFVKYAKEQVEVGIDSLCIKDMAGILSPISAERLVSALIKAVDVPIQLHCHASSGMAAPTYVEGVRAGAGAIDCAIAAMAGTSSQPPVETMVAIFAETDYHADLDRDAMLKVHRYFAELYPQRCLDGSLQFCIDPQILIHQIPGGMISNFRSQLSQQNALDKLELALTEVTKVREDLGWPPLVTPTSQIVGTQAVMNVLSGERYKIVPNEVKDYFRGMYGRPPAKVNAELAKKILGDEKPVTGRPGDTIAPMLPKATEGVDPKYIKHEEDIISYCLLPEPSLAYFKWRDLPADQRPETPADIELKKIKAASAKAAEPAQKKEEGPTLDQILHPEDYRGLSELLGKAGGMQLEELTVRKGDFTLSLRSDTTKIPVIPKSAAPAPKPAEAKKEEKPAPKPGPAPAAPKEEKPVPATPAPALSIKAPLVGTFYSTGGPGKPRLVNPGDVVEAGAKVCIVEAMKLFNEIVAPVKCRIVKFLVEDGTTVEKDRPLIEIEEIK